MSDGACVPGIEELCDAGYFSPLEYHLALTLGRLADEKRPEVLLALALAGRGPQQGQVCVSLLEPPDLSSVAEELGRDLPWRWPEPESWAEILRTSGLVGDGTVPTPLVLDDDLRLYLFRYFDYQRRLIASLEARSRKVEEDLRVDLLKSGLERFFKADGASQTTMGRKAQGTNGRQDGQRTAAVMALLRKFSVISGGPGTGKTTTVLKILALLQEQARAGVWRFPLEVSLLAPTGKAAARLSESIKAGKTILDADGEILDAIPEAASTIHRVLGFRWRHPTRFVHDRGNPLHADVVIVDESSMVDLALMTKLIEAVPESARLIVLGDRDQLASVEAGAILGDICNVGGEYRGWSEPFARRVIDLLGGATKDVRPAMESPPIADCIIHLSWSFRFGARSGIGSLARSINAGDKVKVLELLRASAGSKRGRRSLPKEVDVEWVPHSEEVARVEMVLGKRLVDGYREYLESIDDPAEALERFNVFRVLCAHRHGRYGVDSLNALVRKQLVGEGLLSPPVGQVGQWYLGRPVMIVQNDYQLGLFNGDVGVTVGNHRDGQLRVHFPAVEGSGTRSFHPARLPPHETSFALTVHKSQGSEFDEVLLLLPGRVSPILSRELLYTGVTRARRKVTIVGSEEVVSTAVERRIRRASGLRSALWGNSSN